MSFYNKYIYVCVCVYKITDNENIKNFNNQVLKYLLEQNLNFIYLYLFFRNLGKEKFFSPPNIIVTFPF